MRRGIIKDALKVGSVIHVAGFRARDGSNNASGGTVTFADGRRVDANTIAYEFTVDDPIIFTRP